MDLKKDSRIDFCGGIRGHKELERRCTVDCVAAIAMHPCSLTELMNVADANMIMPPKSTWFEPKPRAGFIVRVFEDDSVSSAVTGSAISSVISKEVIDARAKLAQRYTSGTQIGGKGTQRRTKKVVAHQHVEADKKLIATVKKFGVQSLADIDECNMFKDDNTILNFKKPTIQFSVKENLLIVTGNSEVKLLQDMLPDIIKQVGPQQYEALKNMMSDFSKKTSSTEDDEEDDVPPLVSGTFEDASKK